MNHKILRTKISAGFWTFIKVLGILIVGILVGLIAAFSTARYYKESLLDRARTATQVFDASDIRKLSGSEADLKSPTYQRIKSDMVALQKLNKDSRFVYLLGIRGDDVFFFGDNEPVDSPDNSPPGQLFGEVSDELRLMFENQKEYVEGPIKDRWGIWMSGLAPIRDPNSGELVAVLGIDIPARDYITVNAIVGAFPISVAMIAGGVIWFVDVNRRRHKDAMALKGELISIVSHELNNPLTGIRWGVESLLASSLNESQIKTASAIHASVRHLQESIDDVLEIARLSRNTQTLNLQTTSMTMMIQEIFTTQKLAAEHKRVTLLFSPDWPQDLLITCDPQRIRRGLNNVISNAIKYTREDTSVIVRYQNNNGKHTISVKDAGIGIPKSEQSRVFEGFYRATNAVESGAHGTGMGLYLSKGALKQHGGDLWLESEEGMGTTAHIELPDHY